MRIRRAESSGQGERGVRAPIDWLRDDAWLAVAAPVLIFVGHLLYGAMLPQVALSLELTAALLLGVCLTRPKLRESLQRLRTLYIPASLFVLVLLVALWSMTPLVPGGAHPTWDFLHLDPGAATVDKSATLLEIIKLLGMGSFFLLGAASGGSDPRARVAVSTALMLGGAMAAWAFLTFVTGNQPRGGQRLEVPFMSANAAGTVFASLFVLCAGPTVSRLSGGRTDRLRATPFGLAALVLLVALFATASRGAFIAVTAGMIVFGLLLVFAGRLKWSRALMTAAAATVLILVLLAVAGDLLLNRLLGAPHEFASRAAIFQVHWRAFLDAPAMGYGLGSFDTVNRMLLDPGNFRDLWKVRAAHNLYLAWLEQAGLLGALPMFACVGSIVVLTLRGALQRSRMTSLIFALLAADAVIIVHSGTDFALEMFSVAAMWSYLLGLQLAASQGSSRR